MSQAAGLLICRKGLEMEYRFYPAESVELVLVATALVLFVGLAATMPLVRQKPVIFLREQSDE